MSSPHVLITCAYHPRLKIMIQDHGASIHLKLCIITHCTLPIRPMRRKARVAVKVPTCAETIRGSETISNQTTGTSAKCMEFPRSLRRLASVCPPKGVTVCPKRVAISAAESSRPKDITHMEEVVQTVGTFPSSRN